MRTHARGVVAALVGLALVVAATRNAVARPRRGAPDAQRGAQAAPPSSSGASASNSTPPRERRFTNVRFTAGGSGVRVRAAARGLDGRRVRIVIDNDSPRGVTPAAVRTITVRGGRIDESWDGWELALPTGPSGVWTAELNDEEAAGRTYDVRLELVQ